MTQLRDVLRSSRTTDDVRAELRRGGYDYLVVNISMLAMLSSKARLWAFERYARTHHWADIDGLVALLGEYDTIDQLRWASERELTILSRLKPP